MYEEFKVTDYNVVNSIGSGRYGRVIQYNHKISNVPVALKIVPLKDEDRLRIESEVIYTSQFQGPEFREFFVQLVGRPCQDKLNQYFPLEYCAGQDLSRLLPNGSIRLAESQIQRIVYYVATGLKKMHHRRVCHRDIKAENILLSSTDLDTTDVKICDFGIARIPQNADMTDLEQAPEMVQRKYDCRVDVWSLGVLTRDLLEGRREESEGTRMAEQHDKLRSQEGFPDVLQLTEIQAFIKTVMSPMFSRPTIDEALLLPFLQQWKNAQLSKFAATNKLDLKTKRNYILNHMYADQAKVFIQETIAELEEQRKVILKFQYFEWPEVDVSLQEAESLLAINKFLLKVS